MEIIRLPEVKCEEKEQNSAKELNVSSASPKQAIIGAFTINFLEKILQVACT